MSFALDKFLFIIDLGHLFRLVTLLEIRGATQRLSSLYRGMVVVFVSKTVAIFSFYCSWNLAISEDFIENVWNKHVSGLLLSSEVAHTISLFWGLLVWIHMGALDLALHIWIVLCPISWQLAVTLNCCLQLYLKRTCKVWVCARSLKATAHVTEPGTGPCIKNPLNYCWFCALQIESAICCPEL